MRIVEVSKILTRNDTGETNSHQSGITIPKEIARTEIFPELGTEILNPREEVIFFDDEKNAWKFQYIYYNDRFFGKPRKKGHDEYRLTCVKEYIRANQLCSGDMIIFSVNENGSRKVGYKKINDTNVVDTNEVIKLGNGWHCVKI